MKVVSSSNRFHDESSHCSCGDPECPAVFVLVHESRSGSTYLADLLSRHPGISIAPESDLLRSVWRWTQRERCPDIRTVSELERLLGTIFADEKLRSWGLDPTSIVEKLSSRLPVTAGFVARLILAENGGKSDPGSHLFGLKRGGWNSSHLQQIGRLLPGVRFLNIVRDGRAVFASEKRAIHRNTGRPFQENPAVAAWRWRYYARSFRDAGGAGHEVRYEDLVSDPVPVLSEILRFLGMDSSEDILREMLLPHKSTFVPGYVAELHGNVGKQPLINRIDAWRSELEPSEIQLFERVAGDMLVEKGYQLLYARRRRDGAYHAFVNIQQKLNRRFGVHKWRKSRRGKLS